MRWIFKLIEETEEKYVYGYARESDEMDGVIEFSKKQRIAAIVTPCKKDQGSEWCSRKAIDKVVLCVAEEGFPLTREVITG